MSATTNLKITITADARQAKDVVEALHSQLGDLAGGLRQKTSLSASGDPLANIAKLQGQAFQMAKDFKLKINLLHSEGLNMNAKLDKQAAMEAVKVAQERAKELLGIEKTSAEQVARIRKNAESALHGLPKWQVSQALSQKSADKDTGFIRQITGSTGTGGINWGVNRPQAPMSEEVRAGVIQQMKHRQVMELDIRKAVLTKLKGILDMEDDIRKGHLLKIKARNAMEADIQKAGLTQLKAGALDAEFDRLRNLGKQMHAATGDKGFLLSPGMSHDEIKSYTKEIKDYGKTLSGVEHEIRKLKAAGITDPKVVMRTGTERFTQHQESRLGGADSVGPSNRVVVSPEVFKTIDKFKGLPEEMMHRLTPFRAFVHDVTSFMHMQVRWFASAAILFAIPAAIGAATRAFLEFDKAIQDIAAVTDTSNAGLDSLRKKIIDVSLTVPYSATEIAGLAKMLVQAGLSAGQTANILEGVAQTATISGATLEQTGKAYSTAIFAWKMSSEESAKIGKIIAGTLNESRLNIDDLATAYNYMASTSAQFNISFAEANSVLAVFSNMGIRASTMATGFAQVLSRLVKPTEGFVAAIEKSGKKYEDFVRILESKEPAKFAKMLKFLKEAGVSGISVLRTVGAREGREFAAAINAGPVAFENMYERINDSRELADRFAKAMRSISNQLTIFKNKLVATSIQIGTAFKPLLEVALTSLGFFAKMAFYVADGFQKMGSSATWAVIALGGLAWGVAKVAIAWKELNSVIAIFNLIVKRSLVGVVLSLIGVGVALYSYLRGGSDRLADFQKAADDAAKGAKALSDQQEDTNKVWEKSAALVENYTKRVEELNDISRFGGMHLPKLAYEDYRARKDAAESLALSVTAPIDKELHDIEKKISDIGRAAEDSTGLVQGLLNVFKSTAPTPAGLAAVLTDPLLSRQRQLLAIKEMIATAAQEEAAANAKTYTKPKSDRDTNIAIDALMKAGEKKISYKEQIANIRKAAREQVEEDLGKDKGVALFDALIDFYRGGAKGVADKSLLPYVRAIYKDERAVLDAEGKSWENLKKLLDSTKKLDPIAQIRRNLAEDLRKVDEELALLKGKEKKFKEKFGMSVPDAKKSFVDAAALAEADVYTKAHIKSLEIKKGVEEDLIARETRLLDLAKQTGAVSPTEANARASALKAKSIEGQLKYMREELAIEEKLAGLSPDPEGQNRVDEKRAKILKLEGERRVAEEEKIRDAYKAQAEALDKMRSRLDFGESMGLDSTQLKRRIEFMQKEVALYADMSKPREEAAAQVAVLKRMALVGTGAQSIKEDFKGLWDSFGLGLAEATRGMDDLVNLSADFAKNIVSGFRSGIEGFASGITSKSEMKNWAKTREAELAQTYTKTVDTNKQNTDYEIERLTRLKAITADIQEQAQIEQQIIALKTRRGSIEADAARRYDEETEKLKGNAGWMEFLKEKADTLFQSIVESFTKSLAGMYADLITSGIFKYLRGLVSSKELANAADATAIGQTLTLNEVLAEQGVIVAALTADYYALAAAKMLAGMGGASPALYGPSGANYINTMPLRTSHGGGLVMHGGGIVPRRGLGYDEIATTLQAGEMVINKRDTAKNMPLLSAINRGESVNASRPQQAPVVNNYHTVNQIQTMDASSFRDFALKNRGVFSEMYVRDMRMAGSTRTAGRSYR